MCVCVRVIKSFSNQARDKYPQSKARGSEKRFKENVDPCKGPLERWKVHRVWLPSLDVRVLYMSRMINGDSNPEFGIVLGVVFPYLYQMGGD